jgi:hypothetical protein
MTLKSAFEDLSRTTLRAVFGCLGKLEYLAGLRAHEGDYEHWGFGKVYGQATANKALGTAHQEAISEVLSTPLGKLLADVENSSQTAGMELEAYLEKMSERGQALLPEQPGPGTARHLSSVLHALLALARRREWNATRRAS